MPEPYVVRPDRDFLRAILDQGGGDLKKCFQCATCSVACELSDGTAPFPRKEMIWAQWGLKDRLVADPDVWRCHQCNDCSTRCPRGARPGDVLGALREQTIEHYAVPGFFGKWANSAAHLPVMLAIPAVLLAVAWWAKGPVWQSAQGVLQYAHHEGFYATLYPHWLLIGFYTFFWGLAMLAALLGVVRFWRAMKAADLAAGRYAPVAGLVPSIVAVAKQIVTHEKFGKCTAQAPRRLAHLTVFYGFVALFLVSVWAVVALYMINPLIENDLHYPFGLLNPWKILANLGAVAVIAGALLALRDRLGDQPGRAASTSFDWIFVWLILVVGVTGLLTELMRLVAEPDGGAALRPIAYAVYFVHLVAVFDLLVYLPFSKFAHIVYRSVALVYAEHTGRTVTKDPPSNILDE